MWNQQLKFLVDMKADGGKTAIVDLKQEFRILLSFFGSETARQKFLTLCQEYYKERRRQELAAQVEITTRDSKRAYYHNQIMEVVRRLYIQNQHASEILSPPSRERVGKIIMAYFRGDE